MSVPCQRNEGILELENGWRCFPDVDTFHYSKLVQVLTCQKTARGSSPWHPEQPSPSPKVTDVALRQLEALFNISQLLFALSRGDRSNASLRDLHLGRTPALFQRRGIHRNILSNPRALFLRVVDDLVASGGVTVALSMLRRPLMPMVRQKSLDLLTNVLAVDRHARSLLQSDKPLLRQLALLIRDGDVLADKIPALSVLHRMLPCIEPSDYCHLVSAAFIDCVVASLRHCDELRRLQRTTEPILTRFEGLAWQSIQTVLAADDSTLRQWGRRSLASIVRSARLIMKRCTDESCMWPHLRLVLQSVQRLALFSDELSAKLSENAEFRALLGALLRRFCGQQAHPVDPGIPSTLNQLLRVLYLRKCQRGDQEKPADASDPPSEARFPPLGAMDNPNVVEMRYSVPNRIVSVSPMRGSADGSECPLLMMENPLPPDKTYEQAQDEPTMLPKMSTPRRRIPCNISVASSYVNLSCRDFPNESAVLSHHSRWPPNHQHPNGKQKCALM